MRRALHDPKIESINSDEFRCGPDYTNWRPNGSRSYLLILTVSGSGIYRTRDGDFISQPGHVSLFQPGMEQDYGTESTAGHWHLLYAHFNARPEWRSWLDWPKAGLGLRAVLLPESERPTIATYLRKAIRHLRSGGGFPQEWAMHELEAILLHCRQSRDRRRDARIQKAVDLVTSELALTRSLEELATHAGLSVSRFVHLFKTQIGETPQQFQERVKMDHAKRLLSMTNLTVTEVAELVGFESPFYFTNRFRRLTGLSPSAFRR